MIKAVYKLREDGDYDFVAAFNVDYCIPPFPDGADWAEEVKEYLEFDGESVIVLDNLDIAHLTDIYQIKS